MCGWVGGGERRAGACSCEGPVKAVRGAWVREGGIGGGEGAQEAKVEEGAGWGC